jgi:O-antigen/teichoic acid export membrane protein
MILKVLKVFTLFASAKLGTFAFTAIIAYTFGAEILGVTMTTLSVCIGAVLMSKFGMDLALIKNCAICFADKDLNKFKAYIYLASKLVLRNSLVISTILLIFVLFVQNPLLKNQLFFVVILYPLFSILTMLGSVLKSIGKPEMAAFTDIGFVTLLLSIIIFFSDNLSLVFLPEYIYPIFFGIVFLLLITISTCISAFVLGETLNSQNSLSIKEAVIFKASLFDYFIPGFMHYLIQWGGILIISIFLTAGDVGKFSAAQRISYLVNFILIVANSILSPRFAVFYKENKIKMIEDLAVKSSTLMTVFAMLISIGILINSSYLFELIGVEVSVIILHILILGQLINVSTGSVSFLLNMTGHEKEMRNIMSLSALMTIILLLILVPLLGVFGAAISLSIGLSLQNILATIKVYQVLGIKSLPRFLGKLFYGWK